jgi:hypothetical protein
MKAFFYLIIIGVIIISLNSLFSYRNNNNNKVKISEKFGVTGSPDKPLITALKFSNGTLNISWNKPNSSTNMTGYVIMIRKNNAVDNGLFMNFSNNTDCDNCTYTINNLNLDDNSNYGVSVMGVNTIGSGTPSDILNFQTPEITTPQPTQSIINVPTQKTMPTIFGDAKIKSAEEQRKNYLNDELQNMISRADGIYEINQDNLTYPNISIDDVKQSIHTINDTVKNDLQEYRLNIHLLNSK